MGLSGGVSRRRVTNHLVLNLCKRKRIPRLGKYWKPEREITHLETGTRGKLHSDSVSSLIHSANTCVHLLGCQAPTKGTREYKENTCPAWSHSLGAGARSKGPVQRRIIQANAIILAKCYPCPDVYFHFFALSFFDVPCSVCVTGVERKGDTKEKVSKATPPSCHCPLYAQSQFWERRGPIVARGPKQVQATKSQSVPCLFLHQQDIFLLNVQNSGHLDFSIWYTNFQRPTTFTLRPALCVCVFINTRAYTLTVMWWREFKGFFTHVSKVNNVAFWN